MNDIDISIKQPDGSWVTANTALIDEDVIRERIGLDKKGMCDSESEEYE